MNSKTENNNSHKIETIFPEKVKSILPVTDMNTTTLKTEADVPDDFVEPEYLYARFVESEIVRNKKIEESSNSNPNGDCYDASMITKLKLSGLGAVRVRGGVSSKFVVGQVEEGGLPPYIEHCWVEARGVVYDWSHGKNIMMKKEDWYSMYEIVETEIGTGTFGRFKDETHGKSKKELFIIDRMDCKLALQQLCEK